MTAPVVTINATIDLSLVDMKNIDTQSYNCGDIVRVKEMRAAMIAVIQDQGNSTVSYSVTRYQGLSGKQIGAIVGGIVGGVIIAIIVALWIYKKRKDQKLIKELG